MFRVLFFLSFFKKRDHSVGLVDDVAKVDRRCTAIRVERRAADESETDLEVPLVPFREFFRLHIVL